MRVQPLAGPGWSGGDFPTDLGIRAESLRALVEDSVLGATGSQRWQCRGRVLESALLLVLLRRTGLERAAAARLEEFLRDGQVRWTGVDALLARVALEGPDADGGRLLVEGFLREVPGFQAGSKRALVGAVLALAGVAVDMGQPSPRGVLHPAGRVQVAAVAVILRCAAGGTATVDEAKILAGALDHDGVWEGNLLVHLLAANALSLLPGYSDRVALAISRALVHQRTDGALPFVTDLGTWCAVTAGIALVHTSTPRRSLYALADRLVSRQCLDGGWSYTAAAEHSDTDDTAVAVEFLHTLDAGRYRPAIDRALNHLCSLQGDDGGFATYTPGAPSEAGMTAAALNALSFRSAEHHERIRAGLGFLVGAQQADGLFAPEWSRSRYHVAFRVLLAVAGAPATAQGRGVQEMARRLGETVGQGQNPDGGWGQQAGEASDAISTSYALICLTTHDAPGQVSAGVRHLLAAQAGDGSIVSAPDMLGTRPFLYDVPALADHAALLAVAHVQDRFSVPVASAAHLPAPIPGIAEPILPPAGPPGPSALAGGPGNGSGGPGDGGEASGDGQPVQGRRGEGLHQIHVAAQLR